MLLIIALFGPDGSGKSSITQVFSGTHKIVAIRGTHTLASLVARFLRHFAYFRGSDNPYFEINIPERISALWCFLEFISVLPIVIYRFILLPKFKSVIAERSIPDFLVWLTTTTKVQVCSLPLQVFLIRLCSKQNRLFYVTASLGTLISRRPEQAGLIGIQLPVYDNLSKLVGAYVIDTTFKTSEESANEIMKLTLKNSANGSI
jgi:hypothetical protein